MKHLLAITILAVTGYTNATEDTPCTTGSCTDVSQQQGQTNSNSPVFNSQPNMNMSGSNVLIQQAMDSFVRMGDIQCPSSSLNITGYGNRQNSETTPSLYENNSSGYGISVGISVPIGRSNSACEDAQKMYLKKMEWSATEDNVRMCVDMLNNGFQISDNMKSRVPEFAFCDHIRKVSVESPERYRELVSALQKENVQLREKVSQKTTQKVLKGYKEYRVRFTDYINGCNTGCNGVYSSVKDYIDVIKSNLGKEDYTIYATPYQKDSRVSVYIRGGWYTYAEAEMVRQRFVVAGIPAKVQGVSGSEVWE